jgi:hypothetical protein
MSRDDELCEYLTRSGVEWTQLDESSALAAEGTWREIYGKALVKWPRLRQGTKAEYPYELEECSRFLIVPSTSKVEGLPIHVVGRSLSAYECRRPLMPLGAFHNLEFFVCPTDFAWTMVHTHEDHGLGGPFFIREGWLP